MVTASHISAYSSPLSIRRFAFFVPGSVIHDQKNPFVCIRTKRRNKLPDAVYRGFVIEPIRLCHEKLSGLWYNKTTVCYGFFPWIRAYFRTASF